MVDSELELTREQKQFIKDYVKSINNNNAAIFAGAGLSIPSGTMSWTDLLKDVAEELDLSNDTSTDMATLAQYYENYKESRADVAQLIIESFGPYIKPNINQELIAQLPIDTIWTTNYDDLLEKTYIQAHKRSMVKRSPKDFSINHQKKDVTIYKMHGDITQPTDAIITKNDYETYNDTHLVYTTALKGDLVEKKFLFIGFSFEDPNLDYILARIRALVGENKPNHYFFIEKITRKDGESQEDFELRETKQNLKIKDLKRYGINAVLLNNYKDITHILKIIIRMSSRNNIFISGAKSDNSNISQELSDKLIESVTKELVNKGNKIITGFGKGIGSKIIDSTLEVVSNDPWLKLDDHLKIYPFPQDRNSDWTVYRKQILSGVGISIFLFGTKKENGKEIISNGMIEEFEISHQKGIKVIPVGCTGGASKKIYDIVLSKPTDYYSNNKEVIELIKKIASHPLFTENDVEDLTKLIIQIVGEIQSVIQ